MAVCVSCSKCKILIPGREFYHYGVFNAEHLTQKGGCRNFEIRGRSVGTCDTGMVMFS